MLDSVSVFLEQLAFVTGVEPMRYNGSAVFSLEGELTGFPDKLGLVL